LQKNAYDPLNDLLWDGTVERHLGVCYSIWPKCSIKKKKILQIKIHKSFPLSHSFTLSGGKRKKIDL